MKHVNQNGQGPQKLDEVTHYASTRLVTISATRTRGAQVDAGAFRLQTTDSFHAFFSPLVVRQTQPNLLAKGMGDWISETGK
eukprot:2990668-Pyramimonas_sp.AAC.1